jgi:endonuclease/exonuclease/phosphatase family metal-dependent hydrolase
VGSAVNRRRGLAIVRALALGIIAIVVLAVVAFVFNGANRSWRTPDTGTGGGTVARERVREVHVFACNIAKCFFHEGGFEFASTSAIRERLDRLAEIIRRERSDLVFLSEVVMEAGPAPVNQVEYLAQKCELARFAASENYNFGVPWYRIRSGNALLSRFPCTPIEVMQLHGGQPFWAPTNNRRVLWCEVEINGASLLTGSVRNDSFDLDNNLEQARELLAYVKDRPALLAGDFNAEPHTSSMSLFRAGGRSSGAIEGPPTFPAGRATRRIDYVLAPAAWELVEERVVDTGISDHLAVVAVFRVP